jgi:glucose/mannose-6-phosphate isomerase
MLNHVLNLGNQLITDLVKSDNFPKFNYDRILVIGMGGSGVAGDVLKLILNKYSPIDIEVHKTYKITTKHIENKSLCLFISYSGNTEETLSALEDAIKADLEWGVISSGGTLLEMAKENCKPYIELPSGLQPRVAFGFMTKAVANFIPESLAVDVVQNCKDSGFYLNELLDNESESEIIKISKEIANNIGNKTVVIYGGTELSYLVSQRWKTQINENAKSKSYVGYMPEVHHNEILSWEADKDGSINNFHLIFLRDQREHPKIKNRFEFTKEIIPKGVEITEIENIKSGNLIKELFHLVLIGDLISVFMADNLNVDPYDIDSIENLKNMLKGK